MFLGKSLSFLLFKRTLWLEPVDKFREKELSTSQGQRGKTQLKFLKSSCYLSCPEGLLFSNTAHPQYNWKSNTMRLIFAKTTGIKENPPHILFSWEYIVKRQYIINLEQGSKEENCAFALFSQWKVDIRFTWQVLLPFALQASSSLDIHNKTLRLFSSLSIHCGITSTVLLSTCLDYFIK